MINAGMLKRLTTRLVPPVAKTSVVVPGGPLPLYFAADETTSLTIQQVEALPRGTVYFCARGGGPKHVFTR